MLFIHIIKLTKELNLFDWFSKNDLSIEIIYAGEVRTTTIKWNDNNPIWNEAFLFEINKNWTHPKSRQHIKSLIFSLSNTDITSIKQY